MKNKLSEIRKQHRMNQQELADVLEVTRQTIGSIENGRYDPSLQLAFKIARYFDMAIEEIFSDERVKDMNLRLFWSLEVVGGLLLVLGVALGIVGVDKFDDTMPQGDYAVFAIVFMGVFLIMISTVPILYEKKQNETTAN